VEHPEQPEPADETLGLRQRPIVSSAGKDGNAFRWVEVGQRDLDA
jgi:hypothetical protein